MKLIHMEFFYMSLILKPILVSSDDATGRIKKHGREASDGYLYMIIFCMC